MKMRMGFVSNSSSSSFLIGLDGVPKNAEELHKMLWGNKSKTFEYFDYTLDTTIAAPVAFGQIVIQSGKMLQKQIIAEIRSGWFDGYPSETGHGKLSWDKQPSEKLAKDFKAKYNQEIWHHDPKNAEQTKDYNAFQKQRNKEWKQSDRELDAAAKKLWDKKKAKFKGKKLFRLEFSDNDSHAECVMEHGDIFKKVPHIQISHH
jgi:hypothetical protein